MSGSQAPSRPALAIEFAEHARFLALWDRVGVRGTIRGEATCHGAGWLGAPHDRQETGGSRAGTPKR